MYTPLKFMEQISTMVTVKGKTYLNESINKKVQSFFENEIKTNSRGKCLLEWVRLWNLFCKSDVPEECRTEFIKIAGRYIDSVGLEPGEPSDFYHMGMLELLYLDWSKAKRVYKIEENMVKDFLSMDLPEELGIDYLLKLPSKCFYVELGSNNGIIEDCEGFFVLSDMYEGSAIFHLMSVVCHNRLIPVGTDLYVRNIEDDSKILMDLSMYKEVINLTLEDNSKVSIRERDLVHLFLNLCLYFKAANSDVEYTERTKTCYRPEAAHTNKIRAVEEFGVGFKYSTVIRKGKSKVKYIKDGKEDVERVKRSYSNNYRSAHWHTYWCNDPEHPGEKKRILKWIPETFVHGNVKDERVVIHKVKS